MYIREAQPQWSGIRTFMQAPFVEFDGLEANAVVIAGVPWDSTTSSRAGSRHAPNAIRESTMYFGQHFEFLASSGAEFVDLNTGLRIQGPDPSRLMDVGDLNTYPNNVDRSSESFASAAEHIVTSGCWPVFLGGDHYVTFPLFKGFAAAKKSQGVKKVGYIQLDHHLDLIDEDPLWGSQWHGSNARRISELDMVSPSNMCFVGTGGYVGIDQYNFVKESGATILTMKTIEEKGIEPVVKQAIDIAGEGTDSIYLSIDIDVMDGAYAPGTGQIVVAGMNSLDFMRACHTLAEAPIGAMDLVELNPAYDASGVTVRTAVLGLLQLIMPRMASEDRT